VTKCVRRFIALGIASLFLGSFAYSAPQESPKPLRRAEVLAMVAGRTLPVNIAHYVAVRGLSFRPTGAYQAQLKMAGADSSVLAALDKAKVSASPDANPDSSEIDLLKRLTNAAVFMNQKQYQKAVEELTTALTTSLAAPEAGFVMGAILRDNEDWQEAAAVYTEVLREDPDFPDTHSKLSFILHRSENNEAALREAKMALTENPDDPEAHKNAALGYMGLGKLDASVAEFQVALRLKPDYANVHYDLGLLFGQKHDLDGAIAEYQKAVALDPNNAAYRYDLGTSLGQKQEYDAAIRELREAKRLDPTRVDVRHNLAAYLEQRDMRGAVAEFRELERLAPDFELCHRCLAGALNATGDQPGAMEEYRKAAELDPTDYQIPLDLGLMLERQNKYDEALVAYRKAEDIADNAGATHIAVGRVLVAKKDYASALPELKRAAVLSPADAEAHYLLGRALAATGDRDAAMSEYQEAAAIDPKRSEAILGMAEVLEKRGDWPNAIERYRQAAAIESASNNEDHHGQSFIYKSEAQPAYGAAQLRLEEHMKSLKAAGKTQDVAELQNRIESSKAASGASVKLQEIMQEGTEALKGRRFDDAKQAYEQAIELAEKSPSTNEILITALEHLAGTYGFLGNHEMADSTLHRALTVIEKTYGSGAPRAVPTLRMLTGNAMSSKDFVAAQTYAERALELSQKDIDLNNQVYDSLRLLAGVFTTQNSYDKARPYLVRAVDIGEKLYGTHDYRGMAPLFALCDAEAHLNHPTETAECYQRLVPEMETIYGASHSALVPVLTGYAQSLKSLGRTEEAVRLERRAESIRQLGPQN
jgi:tetratricopeptide (TPR) repeat protein